MNAKVSFKLESYPRDGHGHFAAVSLLALAALVGSQRAEAEWGEATGTPGHFGVVLEGAAEFGGDNLVEVLFTDGGSQHVKAGQGVTLGGGIHYRPVSLPVDFAATVGYKFVRTAAYNTDLGVDRVVIKFTGTVPLGKGVAGFRPDLPATAQKTLNKQLMYCFYWLSADLWVNEK